MYFCNIIVQVTVLDKILNGAFMSYGLEKDFNKIFPKTVHCTYNSLDYSYTVKATCLLPQNYLSDKFVFALWWWFIFVGFATSCLILFHVLSLVSTKTRNHILCFKAGKYWKVHHALRILDGLTWCEAVSENIFMQIIVQNLESDTALDLLNLL